MNQTEKNAQLWDAVLQDLQLHGGIGEHGFEAFISKLSLRADTGTKLVLEHPKDYALDWVEINYSVDIQSSVARVLGGGRRIEFVEEGSGDFTGTEPQKPVETTTTETVAGNGTNKDGHRRPRTKGINSGLNEDYTFENFVVGPNSDFAYNAARAIAEHPCRMHNPLVISGGSGMGKTHLMHAIGNAIRQADENAKVLYVTSEEFTNAYIEAISRPAGSRGESLGSFRRKYRKADVLLMDDMQFIASKDRTQEEFFHTFNALLSSGKQIVISTDCPPARITGLEERLVSRFEQGLNVTLNPPALETRIAILRNKRRQWRSELISDEVLQFIASNITCSVRRLEGALIKLATFASFSRMRPTVTEARLCIMDYLAQERAAKSISIDVIQEAVAKEFKVRVTDLTGRRRTAAVSYPRQIAMYLARQHTEFSLKEIGEAFGGRDHGTVIHASKTVEEKLERDPALKEMLSRVVLSFA